MLPSRGRSRKLGLLAISGLVLVACQLVACHKEAPPPVPPAPPPAAPTAAAAAPAPVKAGTAPITGKVVFLGKPPEMPMLKRQADPFCAKQQMKDEEVMVAPDGGLKNVLVRITQGISGNYEPPMTNATLDQTECMYRPRVQAIMAGQSLLVRNSDQTLHNVHAYRGPSTLFNQAEIPGLPPIAKKFADTSSVLKFKCDVHPWMTAYVGISSHPFFAVTGADGSFTIPKVPAGKYTLEAWHERFGTKTSEITVAAGTPATVTFQYSAP